MGMNFVDRADTSEKYFSDEDNDRVVSILRLWIPARKQALQDKKPLPTIPTSVAEAVSKIVNNISLRYNYRDYPFRDDMVSESIINIFRYLHTFDVGKVGERSGKINFFSWVTTCTDRSFSKIINEEEQQRYIRLRSFEEHGGFTAVADDPDFQQDEFSETTGINMDYRQWMGDYENKRESVREKDREKAQLKKKEELESKMPAGIRNFLKGGV